MGKPHQSHLRGLHRIRRRLDFADTFQGKLPSACQRRHRELIRHLLAARAFHLRRVSRLGNRRRGLYARQPIDDIENVLEHDQRVGAVAVHRIETVERFRNLTRHHFVEQVIDRRPIGQAEHVAHGRRIKFIRAGHEGLVQQRKTVAHRPIRRPRDQVQGVVVDRDPFFGRNVFKMIRELLQLDAAQIETLTPRQDRHRHLADLRRREDELHVFRRLLQRL